jgi:hypothetical protein
LSHWRFGVTALLAAALAAGLAAQSVTNDGLNQNLSQGLHFYIRSDFKNAIPKFTLALGELNRTPGFETSASWRVLVSDLALSYIHVRQFDQARATLDYGLSKDAQYSTFYYDLACLYAGTKDVDKLLAALRQADAYKTHINPGEIVSDPATDEWFKAYWENASFKRTVADLRVGGTRQPGRLEFTVPAAPWTLTAPAGDFAVRTRDVQPDGRHGRLVAENAASFITLTVTLAPADRCDDSRSCRDTAYNSQMSDVDSPQNVATSMLGDIPIFEYYLPSYRGQTIRQQHLVAEFVLNGFSADVHVAKSLYAPVDRAALETFLRSVRLEPKSPGRD